MKTQKLTLHSPFIITPRLMAGLAIGGAFISMEIGPRNGEGRTEYGCFIDLPDGSEHEIKDLQSGCQGGELQEGFVSLLSFLAAAGDSYRYAGMKGEHSDLFPEPVTEWAYQNSDEISGLEYEIEETDNLISE